MSRLSLITAWVVASLAAGASAQPDQPTPRATHAFTITASSVPWLLATGMEARVPLTIRNDGLETWNPDHGFRVAYHWLTLRGTMVSRDGARTELPAVVRPGRSVDVVARLFTPEEPGIYRLQWDMVQEHVTWFSVRDPHFPITHVMVVMPGMNGAFNAVPALTVIALCLLGFIYAARKAWNCSPAAPVPAGPERSHLVHQLALVEAVARDRRGRDDTVSRPRVDRACGSGRGPGHAVVASPPLPAVGRVGGGDVGRAVGPRRICCISGYFGDVISAPACWAPARPAGWAWTSAACFRGWTLARCRSGRRHSAASGRVAYAGNRPPGALVPACRSRVRPDRARSWYVLGVQPRVTDRGAFQRVFRNMNLVEDIGLFGYHAVDLGRQVQSAIVRADLGDDEVAEVQRWFVEQALERSGHGEWFGVAKGRNLIVLQVESMQQFVLRYEIGGQRVMPELNNRLSKAIWFSRMTDQTSEGRTSDGEFVTLARFCPSSMGPLRSATPPTAS